MTPELSAQSIKGWPFGVSLFLLSVYRMTAE
jgi:hypothetical protein